MNSTNITRKLGNDTMAALDIQWLLACYGPCLPRFTPLTGKQFAAEIARVYSVDEPRNKAACKLAESLPGMFSMEYLGFKYWE